MSRVLGAAVLALLLLVTSTALAIWWSARHDSRPSSDAIVVLGSAQYNGVPSSIFEARLEHAKNLYEAGVAPVIVTVGGKETGDQFTEAEAGRDYLARAGVPDDALLAVAGGGDNLQSMRGVGAPLRERGRDNALPGTHPLPPIGAPRDGQGSGPGAANPPTP